MAVSFRAEGSRDQKSGLLPPWIWFWLILYILGFPTTFDGVKTNLLILFFGRDGTTPIMYNWLERVPSVAELLLDLALFLGVLTVFLPWIRTSFLERRYKLTELSTLPPTTLPITLQTLGEVSGFVKENAPG